MIYRYLLHSRLSSRYFKTKHVHTACYMNSAILLTQHSACLSNHSLVHSCFYARLSATFNIRICKEHAAYTLLTLVWDFLEKAIVAELVKKFLAFFWNAIFFAFSTGHLLSQVLPAHTFLFFVSDLCIISFSQKGSVQIFHRSAAPENKQLGTYRTNRETDQRVSNCLVILLKRQRLVSRVLAFHLILCVWQSTAKELNVKTKEVTSPCAYVCNLRFCTYLSHLMRLWDCRWFAMNVSGTWFDLEQCSTKQYLSQH